MSNKIIVDHGDKHITSFSEDTKMAGNFVVNVGNNKYKSVFIDEWYHNNIAAAAAELVKLGHYTAQYGGQWSSGTTYWSNPQVTVERNGKINW